MSDINFIKARSENYLFPGICWKVEHEDSEEGYSHAWNDQIDSVEQSLPPHGEDEGYVSQELLLVPLLATSVLVLVHLRVIILHILSCWHVEYVPLNTKIELSQVDPNFNNIVARLLVHVFEVNLEIMIFKYL